ncbi:MAG: imidazole glycerol phosphate synthase subunit HisH [Rhodospirillaceae bacterium]|nr:imidazole glycerol phosphate synthase subunit HisH [Rhodospirillaceae bacterium]
MIAVVGYGMGNVQSVVNALDHIGAPNAVTEDPRALSKADRILLPGVGAFRRAMERLEKTGFAAALRAGAAAGTPILGICLGMQLLATTGTECGETPGLGLVPGQVERIPAGEAWRLPHMGWNDLDLRRDDPLLAGLDGQGDTACYFVHSYHLVPDDEGAISATCDYGTPVTATISAGSVYGAQFHPEKSQAVGLAILANFAAL